MALRNLISVISPPAAPKENSNGSALHKLEIALGISFPADYKEYAAAYGSGGFLDLGGLSIDILNPLAKNYRERLHSFCGFASHAKLVSTEDEFPFEVFPDIPGLLPWGIDDAGGSLSWLTEGPADAWPIIAMVARESIIERFDMPMTEFLASCFSRKMKCIMWQDRFQKPENLAFFSDR
jgi:hypothetical protein